MREIHVGLMSEDELVAFVKENQRIIDENQAAHEAWVEADTNANLGMSFLAGKVGIKRAYELINEDKNQK